MSVAQRIYKDIEKNGNEHEKAVLKTVTKLISENPLLNLDMLHDLFNHLYMIESAEDKGERGILDYVVLFDFLYDEMGQEHPAERTRRLQEEAKRKEKFPPLSLVQ